MRSVIKYGFTALGLVLIGIGIGGLVIYTQAERFASKSMSEILSSSFESQAEIGSISIAPAKSALILHDVSLKNPAKFKEGEAFTSKRVIVQIDPFSLITDTPVIEQLTFLESKIKYRYELLQGTNIGSLADRLDTIASADSVTPKFIIRKVRCRDAKVELSTNLVPKSNVDLNLVTVELDDLENRKPVNAAKASSIFLRSIVKETLTLKGLLSPILNQLKKESGDDLEEAVLEDLHAKEDRSR